MKEEFKNTAKGKGVRTAYQVLVAWLPVLLGVLTLPEVKDFVEGNTVGTGAIVAVIAGVVAYCRTDRGNSMGFLGNLVRTVENEAEDLVDAIFGE